MKLQSILNLKRRKTRCVICLLATLVVVAFLLWDGSRSEAFEKWSQSPRYLVVWFGMVMTGAVALIGLVVESLLIAINHRRWKALRSSMAEASAENETARAQLLPRL
ncbi:MAG: hypothetical protein KDN20_01735 [Verrucomicrobiae bacterium]|nr:hypothetical protein [Verrucomicrobiae bacterium]